MPCAEIFTKYKASSWADIHLSKESKPNTKTRIVAATFLRNLNCNPQSIDQPQTRNLTEGLCKSLHSLGVGSTPTPQKSLQ